MKKEAANKQTKKQKQTRYEFYLENVPFNGLF